MIKSIHHFFHRHLPGYYRLYKWLMIGAWFVRSIRTLQPRSVLRYLRLRSGGGTAGDCFALHFRAHREPAWVRAKSSDILVFEQIFLKEEYRTVSLEDPSWIMDAGANIGLASLYCLFKYPMVRVLAIEPSPSNFVIMSKNLAPFTIRCILLRAAVWRETGSVKLRFEGVPKAEWAIQVRTDDDGDVPAFDVGTLLKQHGIGHLSLLKIDVEGAEEEIFSADISWLAQVETMAIELHGLRALELVDARARNRFSEIRQDREIRTYSKPRS